MSRIDEVRDFLFFGRGCPKVPQPAVRLKGKTMRNIIWLTLGFALASSIVGCIYTLGYLNGEIAARTGEAHTGTSGTDRTSGTEATR